nr:cytochrome c3 family protein [Citrifermentans bremense]
MVLQDGKITCLSCHDLTKPPHLIKKGDQLCYLCHKSLRAGW